jgi:SAM-dependent methyltransferase
VLPEFLSRSFQRTVWVVDSRYVSGEVLYGDDFTREQIAEWFRVEEHAYAKLAERGGASEAYGYHGLNLHHGFSRIQGPLGRALAFGSAYGYELEPILNDVERIDVLDSSSKFEEKSIKGSKIFRTLATPDGTIPFESETFDLVTCFGVLHHIPHVSFTVQEFARVLRPGGWALIREPTTSMGDWSKPRPGLTPNERGIGKAWMKRALEQAGLNLVYQADCMFSPLQVLGSKIGANLYGSLPWVRIDAAFSRMFSWNAAYVRRTIWHKFGPGSAFFVVRRG